METVNPAFSALDPFPWYRHMRETEPVYYNRRYFYWQIFGYEDVQRVLSDHTAFSSKFTGGSKHPIASSLLNTDPPRHRQLRSLAALAFTPRAVARLEKRVEQIAERLVAAPLTAGRREMDAINELAVPLPVVVIAEMLGVPVADQAKFKLWSDRLMGANTEFVDPQYEMSQYFLELFEKRRLDPQDDLISDLLKAELDGEKLSEPELLGFCVLLLVAGNTTTTNLIGNTFVCFDRTPGLMEQVQADLTLLPALLEEVLRYLSPIQFMYRRAAQTVELGGRTIKAGQIINAYIGSAHRDERQFGNPDTFDLTRNNTRHLAFGYGIHYCMGAPLARLEARIALTTVLTRLRNIRRDHSVELEHVGGRMMYGVKRLPISFEA